MTPGMSSTALEWVEKLQNYAPFLFHHLRLFVCGMNQHTTNPNEQLHWLIKSGYDKVLAAMSVCKSARNMVSKSERRSDENNRLNAENMVRKTTVNLHWVLELLTPYAAKDG